MGVNLLLTGIAVISPIYATITQFGDSAQAVVDALKASDFVTAASELINAPAKLANAFLNGNDMTPGLLTPLDGVGGGGAIAALLKLRDAVAEAIAPPTAPASAAVKTLAAKVAAPAEATTTSTKTDEATSASESSDGATPSETTIGAAKARGPVASGSRAATGGGKKASGASTTHSGKSTGKAGSARHRGAA